MTNSQVSSKLKGKLPNIFLQIVKELLVKNTESESSMPLENTWCTEEELPFETRCKVW